MRARPKALRAKRRYLLVRILPPWRAVEQKALYLAVAEAVTSLFGDVGAARVQPAVVFSAGEYAVIRCQRGYEDDLGVACATVTSVGGERVSVRTIACSGTIAALKARLDRDSGRFRPEKVHYGEKEVPAFRYGRHKVDVLQEDIKGESIVFLTDSESEEI
ncbi:ribonuclease P/MRP protein subunit POP5 [Methanofollis sp. W23]|uniref:Rpp14/Pop5 family protein n=1 Tax=Methanofollis sp. W23 TaxID=2817849 RepID=UPI001AE518A4|nr:Rpp14/Pop5 family protein [Methanofollis sp. W23]MBP2147201.1 ribonuclease P/MRP protein subunit POP5 [Methanofollis sp. W23]